MFYVSFLMCIIFLFYKEIFNTQYIYDTAEYIGHIRHFVIVYFSSVVSCLLGTQPYSSTCV